MSEGRKTAEERKEALARQIAGRVAQGLRVETQSDFQAVMIHGKVVNHVLHLILTFMTLGVWALIWIALVALGGEKRELVQVDEWGNPTIARL